MQAEHCAGLPADHYGRRCFIANEGDSLRKSSVVASLTSAAMQTAACNGLHSISERLARWLLMTGDRVGPDFRLTHETIAQILGSRRATVTIQAELFQRLELLTYRYGRIHIANRDRLTQLACECYELQKAAIRQLLNFLTPPELFPAHCQKAYELHVPILV